MIFDFPDIFATDANGRFKRSTWMQLYTKKGNHYRTNLKGSWDGGSGVYFIRNSSSKEIVYVGSSKSQIKKTIYRHFENWTDKQRSGRQFERKTYCKNCTWEVRLILCTPVQALKAEKYFIRKLQPRDNPLKYIQLSISEFEEGKEIALQMKKAAVISKEEILDPQPF